MHPHLLHVFTCTNHFYFHVEHSFICIHAHVIKFKHTYSRSLRSYMPKFKQPLTSVHVSSHSWNFTPLLFTVFSVFAIVSFCSCISSYPFFLFLYLFISVCLSVIHQLSTNIFPLYFLCSIYLRHYLTKHLSYSLMTRIQGRYTS